MTDNPAIDSDSVTNTQALTLLLLSAFLVLGCSSEEYPLAPYEIARPAANVAVETPCHDRNPLRNLYWGDTHVHTSISSDSYLNGVRMMPEDALRYGFGGSVSLPPYNAQGKPGREASIDRPLDFIAVTDHAEFMGEQWLCLTPDSLRYSSEYCETFRGGTALDPLMVKHIISPWGFRDDDACGADGELCRDAAQNYWQQNIAAAEAWNDNSSNCERTTFIAYEYSSYRMGANLHRNVIFRNNVVPTLPISHIEEPLEWNFLQRLKDVCKDTETGCDVLAIPHNSNIGNGRMFNVDYYGAETEQEQVARAALRAEMEPIVEVYQHKGDSECRNGIRGILNSTDELCRFEKYEDGSIHGVWGKDALVDECPSGTWGHWRPHPGPDCYSPLNYARYTLIEGLAEEQRLGVNPFKFGLIASTDTHNATAGGVSERDYPGHLGMADDTVGKRTGRERGGALNSPGGLIGVWAEENNRAPIFDAMRRKEVFGTSGPRIKARFFGGWNYDKNLCDLVVNANGADNQWLHIAYEQGVPMGGDLPARLVANNTQSSNHGSPRFIAQAMADVGTQALPGTPLQRLQIIKGWVDKDGNRMNKVFDVAGNPNNGASVDTQSCQRSGEGFAQLCTVWEDPEFNPQQRAVYYLRAIENPSCRYNAWQCMGLKGDDRPDSCDVDTAEQPKSIQERAWSSPIWFTPAALEKRGQIRHSEHLLN